MTKVVIIPDRLNLTLPAQSSHVDPTLPLSVKELDAWVRNLPTADVAATTRLVYQALAGTNGCRLTPQLRHALLDRHATQVDQIRSALLPHFMGQPHPLPRANRRIVRSLEKLFRTLATGYEIIAREADGELSRHGVAGAVGALCDAITVGYLGYQTPAPGVWQELHELYRFGTRNDATPIRAWHARYKEALLLELADPNRLTPAKLRLVEALVRTFASQAQLLDPAAAVGTSGGHHLVVFAADGGPADSGDYDLRGDPARGRFLDTNPVAEHLAQLVEQLVEQLGSQQPSALPPVMRDQLGPRNLPFLRRLADLYAQRPRRQHRRIDLDAEVEVVRGISALHSMLDGGATAGDEEEAVQLSGDAHSGINFGGPAAYRSEQWRQINASAQGVGLLRGSTGHQRVQVGDLLGLKGFGGQAGWIPAVVRRLRYRDDDLVVGVQLLASKVRPTLARTANLPSLPQAALLVQQRNEDTQRTLVISQRDALSREQPLTLTLDAREITARPNALIETNDFFDIHELAPSKAQQGDSPR